MIYRLIDHLIDLESIYVNHEFSLLQAAVTCDMVLHQAFRAGHVRKNCICGEVRHGVTSGVLCEKFVKQTCNTSPPQGVPHPTHHPGDPPPEGGGKGGQTRGEEMGKYATKIYTPPPINVYSV